MNPIPVLYSTEAHEDTNLPSANQAYRTPISLHQRTGGPQSNNNTRDQGQGESGRSLNENPAYEFDWLMESEELHWLDQLE